MTFVARSHPQDRAGDDRGILAPKRTAPVETFEELRTRRYQTLINAGIEPDLAWEVAHHNALETVRARSHDDDNYEASENVYGSVA